MTFSYSFAVLKVKTLFLTCQKKTALYPAIIDFDTSIKLKPNQKAFANKGLAYLKLENYSLAIDNFSFSLQFFKMDPEVLYLRGISYLNMGKIDFACEDFTISANLGYELSEKKITSICFR